MSADPLVVARNLEMRFAHELVLDDINLTIAPGELVSLIGPSGCGKSTLLRLLAGLHQPTAGTLSIAGAAPSECHTRLAVVFQDPTLLPWRTVAQNVALPLELDGQMTPERQTDIRATLELVGLAPSDIEKRPHMLSGGMRMRVSLARALVTAPDLLLLDEPFAALDDMLRSQLNDELLRIRRERECTSLFVTHNIAEAVYLSQRVLVMSRHPGRIVAEVKIPFEERTPSLRASAEFAKLTGEVSDLLRETVA